MTVTREDIERTRSQFILQFVAAYLAGIAVSGGSLWSPRAKVNWPLKEATRLADEAWNAILKETS